MIDRRTKILTTNGAVPLWRMSKGVVIKADEQQKDYLVRKRRGLTMYDYTITAYCGEYSLTCTPDTMVICEDGAKRIDGIERGDSIFVQGVARPVRLTMVKSVKKNLSASDMGVLLSVNVIANGILLHGE